MLTPEIRYARRDGAAIAFQVMGTGDDLVLVSGAAATTNMWDEAEPGGFLRALADIGRLTTFDQRGAGRSDPIASTGPLTLEDRMSDLVAVINSADLDRPWLCAMHDGGPVALMAATTYPERFAGLVLVNTAPRVTRADDFPYGLDDEAQAAYLDFVERDWGTGATVSFWAASLAALPDGRARWARLEQSACSPGQAVAQTRQTFETDARHLLPLVSIPTLVVQARDDPSLPAGIGRYQADQIAHAHLVELPSRDHMPFIGDHRPIIAAIRTFIEHTHPVQPADRRLATVVFTDIVDSTGHAARAGDTSWASLLDAHDRLAETLASAGGGRIVKSTGDGLLALFDGPAHAIDFATGFIVAVSDLGIAVRAGAHTGEVQRRGADVAGISVHTAARVAAEAGPEQMLVTRTLVDLTAGSGFRFRPVGVRELKGLDREWELFAVDTASRTS